jgi:hypothetical protein
MRYLPCILFAATSLSMHLAASGQSYPGAMPAWDAFARIPARLEADGTVLLCKDTSAHIEAGQCYVTSWVREPKGLPSRVSAQAYLEMRVMPRLPPGKKPLLVAVGPEHMRGGVSNDSFIAYYRLVEDSK